MGGIFQYLRLQLFLLFEISAEPFPVVPARGNGRIDGGGPAPEPLNGFSEARETLFFLRGNLSQAFSDRGSCRLAGFVLCDVVFFHAETTLEQSVRAPSSLHLILQ